MFEFIYSSRKLKGLQNVISHSYKNKQPIVPLFWTEHCVECSAPACYATCPRFRKRADGDCIRLVDGFAPIKTEDGIGAECEFRTWAKIESQLKTRPLSGNAYARLYQAVTTLGYLFRHLAMSMPFKPIRKFIDDGWFSYRQKLINLMMERKEPACALTLRGVVQNHDHPSTFLVDIKSFSALLYRKAIEIPMGKVEFSVNIPPYEGNDKKELYFINLHPVNAEEHVKLAFRSLELLPTDITMGKKVKCVVWDLDNTIWNGTLIEGNVTLNERLKDLIVDLDQRGIVNSIASKNDPEEAERKLKAFGIDDYFVFKKINWNPKSANIANTIKQMNISPDTVVFVDDNPFERNEVSLHIPDVTSIDPSEMEDFARCDRFNAVVTDDSKKRRQTYKMLETMHKEEELWTGNIDDFLRSCNIKAIISAPKEEEIRRCYELLQRTNQLNSSGRRLSIDNVREILQDNRYESFVLKSSDKFGDYGTVGFLIIDKNGERPTVTDFVISCRVANKKIEPTLINYLANRYGGELLFNYKRTLRNGPMHAIIEELAMQPYASSDTYETYLCKHDASYPDIVDLRER